MIILFSEGTKIAFKVVVSQPVTCSLTLLSIFKTMLNLIFITKLLEAAAYKSLSEEIKL